MNWKSTFRMLDVSAKSTILPGLQSSGIKAPVCASMSRRLRERRSASELLKTILFLSEPTTSLIGENLAVVLEYGGGVSVDVFSVKNESGCVLNWYRVEAGVGPTLLEG